MRVATVFKKFVLYCAHSTMSFGSNHKCAAKHGHSYKIKVSVSMPVNAKTGIAISFEEIEAAWLKTGAKLDHTDLNLVFGENATTELLALYLYKVLKMELGAECEIEVCETESSGVLISVI